MIDISKLGIHPAPSGVQTRDGIAVRIYATDADGMYPIHGAILFNDRWEVRTWTADGRYDAHCGTNALYLDLIPTPVRFRHERWVNVYANGLTGLVSPSRDDADRISDSKDRIACIRIIIEGTAGDGI